MTAERDTPRAGRFTAPIGVGGGLSSSTGRVACGTESAAAVEDRGAISVSAACFGPNEPLQETAAGITVFQSVTFSKPAPLLNGGVRRAEGVSAHPEVLDGLRPLAPMPKRPDPGKRP